MTTIASQPLSGLLDALAAKTPAPGGGASACIAGALAAAQAEMVVAYSIGRKSLAEHEPRLQDARQALLGSRRFLLALADEDAAAYDALQQLTRLPPDDPRRLREHPEALERCLRIPLAALAACANMLRLLEQLPSITNRHLRSDLAIAALLAEAAARASDWNVRINLASLPPGPLQEQARGQTRRELDDAYRRLNRILEVCQP
jgi:formiminotetrahydrofolate cyclodeaminase